MKLAKATEEKEQRYDGYSAPDHETLSLMILGLTSKTKKKRV
jgi:hypothetical protein